MRCHACTHTETQTVGKQGSICLGRIRKKMERCLVQKYTYCYFNSDDAYHLQSSSQLDKAPISYLGQLCSTWNQFKQIDSFQPFCSTGTILFNWYQPTSVRVTLKQCILALHCFICFQILPGSLGIAARVAAVVPLAGQICVLVRMGDSVPPRLTINVFLLLYPSPLLCNISLLSGWQIQLDN